MALDLYSGCPTGDVFVEEMTLQYKVIGRKPDSTPPRPLLGGGSRDSVKQRGPHPPEVRFKENAVTPEVPPPDPGAVIEPPQAFRPPATFPPAASARLAVSVLFFVNGAVFAAWAANIPAVQHALNLEPGPLGLVLLAVPAGAMAGMPLSGWLAPALGSRRVAIISALVFCAALPLLALAPDPALLALALCVFGAAGGATDVTMNAQASEVERLCGRPIMSSFHALFSLGGLAGSGLVAASVALGVAPLTHLVPVALLGFLAALAASRGLLPPISRRPPRRRAFARPPASLLGLGALAFAVLLCEGAAADWSAVYLRNDLGAGPATAAAGFGAFSLAMAVGRLCGDRLVHRLGSVAVVRGSAALAAVGLGTGLLIGRPPAAVAGFACLGLGCSNVVPVLFSAAGRTPGVVPARALAAVTLMGYTAFLAGPPLIGLIAQATTLPAALGLLVVSAGLIVLFAGLVRGRHSGAGENAGGNTGSL